MSDNIESKKRAVKQMLLFLLCGTLSFCALFTFHALKQIYPAVSIRCEKALSAAQVRALTEALQGDNFHKDKGLSLTFWTQQNAFAKTDHNDVSQSAEIISVFGEGFLAYPARLTAGTLPAQGDSTACAVSQALAFNLWGSYDVIGQLVEVDGKDYTVQGLFQSGENIVITGAALDKSAAYTGIELSGTFAMRPLEAASRLMSSLGGSVSYSAFYAPLWLVFLQMYCLLPLILIGCFLVKEVCACGRVFLKKYRALIAILIGLIIALILPHIITAAPSWLIPPRWSDFYFYEQLAAQIWQSLLSFFAAVPTAKDIAAKKLILLLFIFSTASLAATISVAQLINKEQK